MAKVEAKSFIDINNIDLSKHASHDENFTEETNVPNVETKISDIEENEVNYNNVLTFSDNETNFNKDNGYSFKEKIENQVKAILKETSFDKATYGEAIERSQLS